MKKRQKRLRKLIRPRTQLRLIGAFFAVACIGLVMEAMLLISNLSTLASEMSEGGSIIEDAIPSLILKTLAVSLFVLLPLTVAVGVLSTFRIAGPAYRFEQHLGAIARGEDPGPCRLRRGDDFQEICDVLNAAVDTLRTEASAPPLEERPARTVA